MTDFDDPNFVYDFISRRISMPYRATLVTARDGGPIRTIINGGSTHAMGRYHSGRTGRAQPWKTTVERSRYMVCEVDPDVRTYLAFPHRLDFAFGKKKFSFWPSLRVDFHSGKFQIERLPNRRSDPDEEPESLVHAKDIYRRLGWTFVSRTVADVEGGQDFANARKIELDNDVQICGQHVSTAAAAIAAGGGVSTYAAVSDALGGGRVGRAILHGLIVHGHLAFPLDKRLKADTPVWARR